MLDSWQSFVNNINLLDKFFICKLNIYIAKSKKKYSKNHFHIYIYQ